MKTYLIIFIILSSFFAKSQELKFNDGGLVTDGEVSCIRNYGDTIGIGGTFNYVGQHTGAFVQIDTSNGSIIAGLPKVYGSVSTIVSDGQNGFYIGGFFDKIGTTSINNLAHINADYSIDLAFNPSPNGNVKTLINKGSTLYVLGNFTQISGVSRNYLSEINRITGVVTSWNPNSSANTINTIALVSNKIIVGGSFTTIAGQSRNNIAAFDTSTNNIVNTFIPNFNGSITKIISKNSRVYVSGNFTTVNSVARNTVACLLENGNLLNFTISLLSGSYIQDLIPYKDSIIISFGNPGLLPYINKYDTLGSVSNLFTSISFGNTAGQSIRLVGIVNEKLIISTQEFTIASTRKIRYAVLNLLNDDLVYNWKDNSNAAINCVLNFGNTLLLGGAFSSIGGSEKNNIALFRSSTNALLPFNPQFTPTSRLINAIDIRPNGIFVAGVQYNNQNSSGRLWLFWNNGFKAKELTVSFPTSLNGTSVTAMKVINNQVYIAGKFDQIGTTINRVRAAVLDTSLTTIGYFPGPGHTNTLDDGQGRISEINNDSNGNIIYVGGKVFDKLGGVIRGTFYSMYMLSNSGIFIRSLNNLMAYVKRIKIDRDSAYYIDPNGGIGTSIISSGTSFNLYTSLPTNNEFTSIEVVKNSIIYTIYNNSLGSLSLIKGFNKTTNITNLITYDSLYGVCNDALHINNKLYFIGLYLQKNSQNEPNNGGLLSYSVLENKPTTNSSNLVISSITNTSMTLNWTVGNGIGRIIVAKQLNLATSIPVSGVIYSPNSIFGQGSIVGANNYVVYNGNGNTVTITGLSINQSYQFSIYEYNGNGGSINYLTSIVYGTGTTLPVKLISFNATLANEKVNCTWETASETNNDYFTIERSKDGNGFEAVGNVKGQGNSNSNIRYSYIDNNPFSGISYYRLKQTDFDGKYTQSEIKKVGLDKELASKISLYYENENPIVKINSLAENSITIELLNLNGIKLFTNEQPIIKGENTFAIDGNITKGLYLLKVKVEDEVQYFKVWLR